MTEYEWTRSEKFSIANGRKYMFVYDEKRRVGKIIDITTIGNLDTFVTPDDMVGDNFTELLAKAKAIKEKEFSEE